MSLEGQQRIDFGDGDTPSSARDYQLWIRDAALKSMAETGQALVIAYWFG